MTKPNDETFKNRHVNRKKTVECKYEFPNTGKPKTQFCTVEDILYELTPVKKKKNAEKGQ